MASPIDWSPCFRVTEREPLLDQLADLEANFLVPGEVVWPLVLEEPLHRPVDRVVAGGPLEDVLQALLQALRLATNSLLVPF